jgi:hypothetical protein
MGVFLDAFNLAKLSKNINHLNRSIIGNEIKAAVESPDLLRRTNANATKLPLHEASITLILKPIRTL